MISITILFKSLVVIASGCLLGAALGVWIANKQDSWHQRFGWLIRWKFQCPKELFEQYDSFRSIGCSCPLEAVYRPNSSLIGNSLRINWRKGCKYHVTEPGPEVEWNIPLCGSITLKIKGVNHGL